MGSNATARKVALDAVQSLGRGFDVTADFRTKFCKKRLVDIVNDGLESLTLPGGITIDAPSVIKCDKGECTRHTSDLMQFQQMSEAFNKCVLIDGKIPLGHFNAMYDFTGSWFEDAMQTKNLAFDGKFITLFQLQLTSSLLLRKEVKNAVPSAWEPAALARFISLYGTHIVVRVSVGGQNVLYLKENASSMMSSADVHKHLKDLGDQMFAEKGVQKIQDGNSLRGCSIDPVEIDGTNVLYKSKDLTIIAKKRGGRLCAKTPSEWQATVMSAPDVIMMSFVPITALLSRTPGSGFLNHAINLYLRYKPPIEDIQCFLEFQVPRQWAPVYSDLPLGPPQRTITLPSLQFCLMGPRLYVNTAQISVGRKPVTGLRLYLEGRQNNRLAIHLQHLSSLPRVLEPYWNPEIHEQSNWHGSENVDSSEWFEHVQCRSFSHVCTARVKYNPEWTRGKSGVFVVTGAQLVVKSYGLKNVMHLRLQFSRIPGCTILKSRWYQPCGSNLSEKSRFFSALSTAFTSHMVKKPVKHSPVVVNSGVFLGEPPIPIQQPKLLRFVDTRELTKGPQDMPGHWLVIGAQLDVDGGKISLNAKYSLLNFDFK